MSSKEPLFEIILRIVTEGYALPDFEICCKRSLGLTPEIEEEEWAEVVQLVVGKTLDEHGIGNEYELVAGITLNSNNYTPRINWLGVYHRRFYGSHSIKNKNVKTLFLAVREEHVRSLICPELLDVLNIRIREFMKVD